MKRSVSITIWPSPRPVYRRTLYDHWKQNTGSEYIYTTSQSYIWISFRFLLRFTRETQTQLLDIVTSGSHWTLGHTQRFSVTRSETSILRGPAANSCPTSGDLLWYCRR